MGEYLGETNTNISLKSELMHGTKMRILARRGPSKSEPCRRLRYWTRKHSHTQCKVVWTCVSPTQLPLTDSPQHDICNISTHCSMASWRLRSKYICLYEFPCAAGCMCSRQQEDGRLVHDCESWYMHTCTCVRALSLCVHMPLF